MFFKIIISLDGTYDHPKIMKKTTAIRYSRIHNKITNFKNH